MPTARHVRAAQRAAKREDRQRKRDQKLVGDLTAMLVKYMSMHYGNPATGKHATILNAPVIARLSAAASLYALLKEPG